MDLLKPDMRMVVGFLVGFIVLPHLFGIVHHAANRR